MFFCFFIIIVILYKTKKPREAESDRVKGKRHFMWGKIKVNPGLKQVKIVASSLKSVTVET